MNQNNIEKSKGPICLPLARHPPRRDPSNPHPRRKPDRHFSPYGSIILFYFSAYQEGANIETVKVSSKGQIVIPKALREAGNIQAGTELIISAIADGLMLTPAQRIKPTKVADGLGMLAKPSRKKPSDAEVKRRIGAMLKHRDDAAKSR